MMSSARRTSLSGRCAVVAAAVLGSVLLTASPASAAPVSGTETVGGSLTIPANSAAALTVTCPAGKTVTGGGFNVPQSGLAYSINVRESRPVPGVGWRVAARNLDSVSRTIGVYAVCSSGQGRIYPSTTFTLPVNGLATGTVTCPSGVAVGGGFRLDTNAAIAYVNWSRPAGTSGWTIRADNVSTLSNRTATVWAVCGDFSGRSVASQSALVDPGTSYHLVPTCPAGRVSTGGGFAHGGAGPQVWSSSPADVGGDPTGWSTKYVVPGTLKTKYEILAFNLCVLGS